MASILKVDDLRGNTSAGDITITSEGGSATMQLQQGINKAWANIDGNTPSIDDSINATSLVDGGSGTYTTSFVNNMSNATYAPAIMGRQNVANVAECFADGPTNMNTGSCKFLCYNNDATPALRDYDPLCYHIAGDLA